MKKFYLACFVFFTTSLLCFSQDSSKKLRAEFVVAYNQANNPHFDTPFPRDANDYRLQESSGQISSYAIGSNLSYSFSKKIKLSSGIRLHSIIYGGKTIHPFLYSRGSMFCGNGSYSPVNYIEYYLEVPLRVRYFFYEKKFTKLYAEVGLQHQIYLTTELRVSNSSREPQREKTDFSSSHSSGTFSIGSEFIIHPKLSYFIQGIMNKAFLGNQTFSTRRTFYGIETGIRF